MQKVQLYIEGQRVDFFDDQKTSINQSIQDLKDPANIFTDFSKTFNIPASKTNNKIFKHFYNFDIVGGFDARKKVSAEIKINFVSFKKGYIKLEGTKLKDNAPNSYDITFFGETVILKDTIGEDNLTALAWLDNFVLDYSSAEMQQRLQSGQDYTINGTTYNDAVLAPLITHTSKLFYNTTTGHQNDEDYINNVHYDTGSGSGHHHGVLWSDLKYSLRLHLIILAIQEKYTGIVFSDDFFNVSNSAYHNLYMWMHRKKGNVESSLTGGELFTKLVTGFNSFQNEYIFAGGSTVNVIGQTTDLIGTLSFAPSNNENYNIKVQYNGTTIETKLNIFGAYNFSFSMLPLGSYSVIVESQKQITFTTITWQLNSSEFFTTLTTTGQTIETVFEFYPTQQLPEIKVLDFLKGIFKMFNLTAYVNDEGIIVIDKLDNFYANFNEYDITEYIDINQSNVNNALPYKQIDFIYDDYKTFLAAKFNQINGQNFGELKYNGEGDNKGNWVGDIYKINLPFQKMLYERLTDLNGGTQTTIQYGWMADDNQAQYIGKPLLHYVNQQSGGTELSFRQNDVDHIGLSLYNIPLNSNGITGTGQSLNFKPQYDEYALVENPNTLFENYYKNYISDVFNLKKRISKFTAYLPLKILLNYTLKDRFIVNGNVYKINNIKSDLQNGKSDIELINEA